jgi:RNA polymerase sigma-70 factor (TIGR02943 family)
MYSSNGSADPRQWVALYGDMLFQYALPRVKDTMVAEDIVQETFLSALKGLAGYKGEASEKNWLFAILRNKIVDHYRGLRTEILALEDEMPEGQDGRFVKNGMWRKNARPKPWPDPGNPMEQKEMRTVIDWCKEHLKALPKMVFILKYLEEKDSEEICKVLDIKPSNYWVLIHRARLQMRECLEKHWLKK